MNEFDQDGDVPDYTGCVFGNSEAPNLPEVSIGGEGDDTPIDDTAPEEYVDTTVLGSEDETIELLHAGMPDDADTEPGDIDPDLLDMAAGDLAKLRASLKEQVAGLTTENDRLRAENEFLIGETVTDAAAELDDELLRFFDR
jgi:hypothetical protein